MKVKALRYKKEFNEFQEFVHIEILEGHNSYDIYTSDLPKIQPETATIEEMDAYHKEWGCEVDFDQFELVEFELIEQNTVGADIRNKLSPCLNLVEMLREYFSEDDAKPDPVVLEKFIKDEMEKSEKNIEYIANLL